MPLIRRGQFFAFKRRERGTSEQRSDAKYGYLDFAEHGPDQGQNGINGGNRAPRKGRRDPAAGTNLGSHFERG
jgi:hypothetical protein